MARSNLGENIAKYRKEAGINQEELGKAVGVSAQAVSRWECGGTPDVELLPAIADRLHVSVDALFGRDGTEALDLRQLLADAVRRTPAAHRMETICDYIWIMQQADMEDSRMPRMLSALQRRDRSGAANPAEEPWEVVAEHNRGINLYGLAKDMPFALVLPEPEGGFAAMLKKPEEYVRLFQLLSKPRYLDMLLEIFSCKPYQQITDRLAAARLKLPLEEAQAILNDLFVHCMLQRTEVEDENGKLYVYRAVHTAGLPVFLFFCRQVMQSVEETTIHMGMRDKAIFATPPGTGSLAPDWNTLDRAPEENAGGVLLI